MESQEHHNNKPGLDVSAFYDEVCTNIRTTDEISFKLLGLVPFASAAGIIGISTIDKASLIPGVRLLIALFAVTITFALFIWEKRNIQLCDHYIACAECIERRYGFGFAKRPKHNKWPRLPRNKNREDPCKPDLKTDHRPGILMRKTNAENIIYGATMISWLSYGIFSIFGYLNN